MATTPPIDIVALKKTGALKEDVFYQALSVQCNYIDKKAAKEFYMGLVRTITKELRDKGVVRLPHLGDVALVKLPPHRALAGKVRIMMDGVYSIKFYPNYVWKKYFANLTNRTGARGAMDPREKILNRQL